MFGDPPLHGPQLEVVTIASLCDALTDPSKIPEMESEIARIHRDKWKHHYAKSYSRADQIEKSDPKNSDEYRHYDEQIKAKKDIIANLPPTVPKFEELKKKEWLPVDRAIAAALVFIIIVLMISNSNAIAQFLINSNNSAFNYPNEWRAYLMTTPAVFSPLAIELYYHRAPDKVKAAIDRSSMPVLLVALLVFFATLFIGNSGRGGNAYEVGAATDTSAAPAVANTIAFILSEICIAIIVFHFLVHMFSERRDTQTRKSGDDSNPDIARANEEIHDLEQKKSELVEQWRKQVTKAQEERTRLEKGESVFVANALSLAKQCLPSQFRRTLQGGSAT